MSKKTSMSSILEENTQVTEALQISIQKYANALTNKINAKNMNIILIPLVLESWSMIITIFGYVTSIDQRSSLTEMLFGPKDF